MSSAPTEIVLRYANDHKRTSITRSRLSVTHLEALTVYRWEGFDPNYGTLVRSMVTWLATDDATLQQGTTLGKLYRAATQLEHMSRYPYLNEGSEKAMTTAAKTLRLVAEETEKKWVETVRKILGRETCSRETTAAKDEGTA